MKNKPSRLEQTFKLVLVAFFVFLYLLTFPYPKESQKFPQLISAFALIMLGLSFVLDFAKKGKKPQTSSGEEQTGDEETKSRDHKVKRKRFFQTWAILLVAAGIGYFWGFLFSTFLLFLGFALFFGRKKDLLRNLTIGIITTLLTYFIFEWLMGVPLLEK
jgi:uncharacterized protein YhhL (DUF1145 family)